MDKEKEIKDMAQKIYERGVALSPLDFVYGAHGDDHFTRIAKYLSDNGYGNVAQAVKEFAEKLKENFFFMKTSTSKDAIYQFTDSQLNELIMELYGNKC